MGVKAVVGQEAKLYRNTGTHATPTWVEMKRAIDVSITSTKDKADTSRRESSVKRQKGAMKDLGIEFGYRYKRGTDADWDALWDSFWNGTPIEFAVMDGDIGTTGNKGLLMYCEVFDFPSDEPLSESKTYNVGVAPTDYEEADVLIEPEKYVAP